MATQLRSHSTTSPEPTDYRTGLKASRMRIPRSRGAVSGVLLLVLGAWAALVPFIGPYFDFGITPAQNDAWHWTAGRGWLELLPGAAAFVGGLILLMSRNRAATSFGSWLGIAGGAWLVVGPTVANQISLNVGTPDPTATSGVQTLEQLFYFTAVGAATVLVAAFALGRLSVHSVRDVAAAQKRLDAEEQARAAEAERASAQQRATEQRRQAEQRDRDELAARAQQTQQSSAPRHEGETADESAREYAHHGAPSSTDGSMSNGSSTNGYGTPGTEDSTQSYPPYRRSE